MHASSRPTSRDWVVGVLVGALLGLAFLGVGGRIGMRAVALANGRVPFFTAEGSIAVALFGAAAGAGVGVIFLFARFAAPNRRAVRLALFSGGCAFLVLRGLRPLTILSITIFGSLFVVHAALLHVYWCRIHIPHRVRPSRGP